MNKKQLIVAWTIFFSIFLFSGCTSIKKATQNFFNLFNTSSGGRHSYDVDSYDVYREGYGDGYDEGYSEGSSDGFFGRSFDSFASPRTYSDFPYVQEKYEAGFEEGFRDGYEEGYGEGAQSAEE